MKTKKSIWSIALSLIIVLALVVGINLNMQPKAVNAANDEHITFDVKVDEKASKSVARNYAGDLVVTYTVTETTGVDALQLRLGYDHEAFTLKSVVTKNDTTLGEATKGKNGEIDNDNVVYENTKTEGAAFVVAANNAEDDVLLITATFNLNHPTAATAYTFSLYNANDVENLNIGYSRAWRIENGTDEQSATHAPVQIRFANEAIVYVRGSYTDFTLEGGSKTYDGVAVPNSAITITHGENTPEEIRPAISAENVVWFTYNEALWQEQNVSRYIKLDSNPVAAGTYYAVVEFNGNNFYDSYKGYTADELYGDYSFDIEVGKVAEYVISPRAVNVTIDSKESAYGETLKPLTYTVDTQTPVIGNDDLGISLFSDANSLVPGTSPITGSAGNANYAVSFTNGTYTVTARNITVIIADKESVYGAPIVELTYTIDANTTVVGEDDLGISLSTTATSSSNVGPYPITGSASNTKYNVTFRNTAGTDTKGTYTIKSQNINALNYFDGDEVTFDANSHDLLIVDENKPNWVSHTAENNNQTNANTYQITITVTISTQDALNYLSSDLLEQLEQTENGYKYVTTVQGKINPKAVTVEADNKSHVYGNTPATLTPVTVGVNKEVTVNFVVKNGNETITLSTETPVGEYTIVPSATNSNYAFTFNNGTYEVTKADAVITVNAEDVFYNRAYNYSATATANSVNITPTIVVKDANGNAVNTNSVLDAGTYTVEVTVAGNANYNGATKTKTFKINQIAVETPTVTYNGSKATWAEVSNDAGATNVNAKELYNNSTVTYTIGGTEYSNREFTPTAAGNYTLVITPSNENYLPVEVQLETVYSVVFTEGTHTATQDSAQNMPNAQYVFKGQKATQPATNPTLTGYTFSAWDFNFNTAITANTTIPALWTISQRTMTVVYVHSANNTYVETSKTFDVNYNSNVTINTSNFIEKAHITDIVSQYNLNGMRYTFNGFWNYKVTGEDEYIRENVTDIVVNATENYTFVALYTSTPINYEITYMYRVEEGENPQYAQYGEKQTVAYNAVINYRKLANVAWFRGETWFADQARTTSAPVNMPAGNLTVYGAYVFNIGLGDVNADGNVDPDDISLYRRWIVGGYEMTEVESGKEWATVKGANFNANDTYFLTRVADDNAATLQSTVLGDQYLDIRDVSTIRMAMVGGYGFSIHEGYNVDGEEIVVIRTVVAHTASDLLMLAKNGQTVELTQDITDPNFVFEILDSNKDIIIDLNGHTLTLKSFRVTLAEGNTGKILVTNGRINVADGNGVYLTAVDGSVHLDNVTLYDDNGLFVIQTANHSLHLFNVVKFLKKEIVNNVATEAPAEVLVVKDTHIVVENTAVLEIAKVVVAEIVEINEEEQVVEQVVPVAESSISIDVKSEQVNKLVVEGYAEVENDNKNVVKPTYIEVATKEEFIAAAAQTEIKGIKLTSDLADLGVVNFADYITIDGNGKTISGNSALNLNVKGAKITNVKFQNIHNANSNLTPVYATKLSGKLEIENCELNTIDWDAIQITPVAGAEIVIKNNTFKHSGENAVNTRRYVHIQSATNVDFTATIENNKFYNVEYLRDTAIEVYYPTNENKVVILNNYVDAPVGVCVLINNGTNAYYLANSFVEEDLETSVTMVAAIIETYSVYFFRTLQEAVDFAGTTARTITLLSDANGDGVKVGGTDSHLVNQNITFDFNNHTYTVDGALVGSKGTETLGFQLLKDSTVTFKNGTLKTVNAIMLIQNYANTTLDNFTVSGEGATQLQYVTSNNFGSLTVKDGSKILANNNQVAFDLWYGMSSVYDDGVTVTLKAGSEVVGKVEYGAAQRKASEDFSDKAVLNVEDGAVWGKKITLVSNIYVDHQIVIEKDLTLNLNGKTVKYIGETMLTSGLFGVKRGATLTINDTKGTGKIDASSNKIYAAVVLTINSAEGATGEKAKVVVNGGTLEGYYYAITGNGNRHNTEVVVNNGTLRGLNGTAIYNPQDGLVTINNGHFTGIDTAIEIRAGELVINDGEFEALSQEFSIAANGSGTTTTGVIIAVSQHSTQKNITVTINGGTFTNGICALAMSDTISNNTHNDLINVTINDGTFNTIEHAQNKTIHVNNGNLVIKGGNFNCAPDSNGLGSTTVFAENYGYVTINGGTFRSSAKYDNRYWVLNVRNNAKDTAKMLVCGGTFCEFDPSNPNTDDSVSYVSIGYTVQQNGDVYTVKAGITGSGETMIEEEGEF